MTTATPVRRLRRADAAPVVLYAALIAVSVLVTVLHPGLVAEAADQALQGRLASADDRVRTVTVQQLAPAGIRAARGAPRSEETLREVQQELLAAMPAGLRDVVGPGDTALQTATYFMQDRTAGERPDPQSVRKLLLRAQSGLAEHTTWIDGRPPAGHGTVVVDGAAVPRFEVGLSTDVAGSLGVGVGSRLLLVPERFSQVVAADVTGVFEPTADDSWYWAGEPRALVPTVAESVNSRVVTGVGLVSASSTQALDRHGVRDADATWRFPVDVDSMTAQDARPVATALGTFEGLVERLDDDNGRYRASSGLGPAIDAFEAELGGARALMSVAATGFVAVAVTAIVAMGWLLADRRLTTIALLRARGASRLQAGLVLPRVLLPATLPAAIGAAALAVLLAGAASWALPVLVASAALVLATAVPAAVAVRGTRRDGRPTPGTGIRVTVEVTVAVLALGGVTLMLRGTEGPSLVVALAPTLVILSLALLSARLMSWAVHLGRQRAGRGTGTTGLLVLAGAGRLPVTQTLALVAVVVAVAEVTFALTLSATSSAAAYSAASSAAPSAAPSPGPSAASAASGPSDAGPLLLPTALAGTAATAAGAGLLALTVLVVSRVALRGERARTRHALRAIGLPVGADTRLALLDSVPSAVTGLATGLAAGLVVAALVTATVDIDAVTGVATDRIVVPSGWLAGLGLGWLLAVAAAGWLESHWERRE